MMRLVYFAPLLLAGCATVPAPQPIVALGTEPFWSVEVQPGSLTYTTPENQAGTLIAARSSADALGTTHTGKLAGQPFVLRITAGPCSDGMSDMVYPWTATLTVEGRTERGCAKRR